MLRSYAWPGNVRELRNAITQAVEDVEREIREDYELHDERADGRPAEPIFGTPGPDHAGPTCSTTRTANAVVPLSGTAATSRRGVGSCRWTRPPLPSPTPSACSP